MKKRKNNRGLVATNRKARHDYTVLHTVEAGIALRGYEIKSIRAHHVSLKDGFARIRHGVAYLENVHITPYSQADTSFSHINPRRDRMLLLHKQQIKRLHRAVQHQGITLIPLKMYIKHGMAKLLLGVARGRHEYDKRRAIKNRDTKREVARYMKNN